MKKDFKEFKDFIKNKKVALIGIGVSNRPLAKFLSKLNANVTLFDKKNKEDLKEEIEELKEYNFKYILGDNYLEKLDGFEVIFRSPSIMPHNEHLLKAQDNGAYITSEIRELVKYSKTKVIGVTGSDGKTTTTTIISELLKTEGHKVWLGGNIGIPLFSEIENIKENDYVVLELSSFQLMDFDISPDIALITNLSPNHLDIHKDMDEYIESKKNIFKYQNKDGIVVLNYDNDITSSIIKEITGNLRTFSIKKAYANAYLYDTNLFLQDNLVCNEKDIVVPGKHNIENFLAAFAVTKNLVSIETMKKVAQKFSGVAHRIEFVREIEGVKYYNDSIASSPTRTLAGLNSFNNKLIVIAGGYDKHIPFEVLAEEGIDRIQSLILIGQTTNKIKKCFEKEKDKRNIDLNIIKATSLEEAVTTSKKVSNKGDVVILSPACASFDMFKNFETRGNKFKEIVQSL